jgi:hypothetical protein
MASNEFMEASKVATQAVTNPDNQRLALARRLGSLGFMHFSTAC